MSLIIVNRDIQPTEFIRSRVQPDGLAKRYQLTWSAAIFGNSAQELFLPGGEVIVAMPRTQAVVRAMWSWYSFNEPASESASITEPYASFRFYTRANGSVVFSAGAGGLNVGAPPSNLSIGIDFPALPNIPNTRYMRVRVAGFPSADSFWGISADILTAPRVVA